MKHFDCDPGAASTTVAECAEDRFRHDLPAGRHYERYRTMCDIDRTKRRSMSVCLEPPGVPGKWTDAATAEHGDLLDLSRPHVGGGSLRPTLKEALTFLGVRPAAHPQTSDL